MENGSSGKANDVPGFSPLPRGLPRAAGGRGRCSDASPAARLDAPLQAGLSSESNDRLGKRSISLYFRINIVKLTNFQLLTVKHTVFPLTAGGKIEKKYKIKVPGINLFCLEA